MAHRYELHIAGFELGTERAGHYLKLHLRNAQPFSYSLTRYRFETEGLYAEYPRFGPMVIPENTTKLVKFAVHDFQDIALWLSGTRSSAQRNPRRHLASYLASWAPPELWQPIGAKLEAKPTRVKQADHTELLDRLLAIPGSLWQGLVHPEIWPMKTKQNEAWSYLVTCTREGSSLRTGPYLRQRDHLLEHWYTGSRGIGWYDAFAPLGLETRTTSPAR